MRWLRFSILASILAPLLILAWSPTTVRAQTPLYGCTGGDVTPSSFYRIDPGNGSGTLVGPMGMTGCSGLASDPASQRLFAVGLEPTSDQLNTLWTVDISTGAATKIGPTGIENILHGVPRISDLSFQPSTGRLFAFFQPDSGIGTVNLTSGLATVVGSSEVEGCCGHAMAFAADGRLFHADEVGLDRLNPASGSATRVAPLTLPNVPCPGSNLSGGRISGMDFDSNGTLYGTLNCGQGPHAAPIYLVTINTVTGVLTNVGTTVDTLDGIAFQKETSLPGDANCDLQESAADLTALVKLITTGGRADCGRDDADGNGVLDARDLDGLIAALFAPAA